MQEKKVSIQLFFLVPFDLPFLSNAILKKSIDETKKKRRVRKSFQFVSRYFFSNRQKKLKNHISTFYNDTGEFLESCKYKKNHTMILSSEIFFVFQNSSRCFLKYIGNVVYAKRCKVRKTIKSREKKKGFKNFNSQLEYILKRIIEEKKVSMSNKKKTSGTKKFLFLCPGTFF